MPGRGRPCGGADCRRGGESVTTAAAEGTFTRGLPSPRRKSLMVFLKERYLRKTRQNKFPAYEKCEKGGNTYSSLFLLKYGIFRYCSTYIKHKIRFTLIGLDSIYLYLFLENYFMFAEEPYFFIQMPPSTTMARIARTEMTMKV